MAHAIPAWRVTLDGKDLTDRIRPHLLDLTLTEARDGEADQLDLSVLDRGDAMALPRRGVALSVALGWRGGGLVDKGTFTVDEVEHSGPPSVIAIRARSADLTKPLRIRRERSWHGATLGTVLREIAGEHGLQARIAPALAGVAVAHLDQTESDVALLARLGKRYDAVATVKAGCLLFAPVGSGRTTNGVAIPEAAVRRQDCERHRFAYADRDRYSGVRAYWSDREGANRKSVLVGESGNAKRLGETFPNETQAREHAQAEWARVQRGAATFGVTLAMGRPELYPEQRVRVRGFKPEIDGMPWLIAKATHTMNPGEGLKTSLELEAGTE
ncbi:contractile injection system protein, VgrG/Pvc8 family [Lysobacter firmicutimachus]|uniref:Contractile injection system protein, VgrG/Pvc8 family n=1 Tax=Lysobacter firmicutimachus TaxID=1792846 RepID=A0ABU8D0N4_9GAMM